jgi:formylglycine-generating enzyme required for sulfatase activity
MTNKQPKTTGACFTPAFLVVLLLLFLFASCAQPNGGDIGVGQPPAAPDAPVVTSGSDKLTVSWQAVPGASAYEVFWGTEEPEPGPSLVTVDVSMAAITGLTNGTTYYVRLRAKNSAGTSDFSPTVSGIPGVQSPAPSVIRGDGKLSVGWIAENGVEYTVWYGTTNNSAAATQSGTTITGSGITGTTITGISNGTIYYVWIKTGNNFGEPTTGTPEAQVSPGGDFVYVPGGTVTGSGGYAFTVTVPEGDYNFPGSSSAQKGVFVEGRIVPIGSFFMAKYETTRQLWYEAQSWAQQNGYSFQNLIDAPGDATKNKPVINITWRDAIVWCNAYSEKTPGLDPVYTYNDEVLKDSRTTNATACDNAVMDPTKNGYRLPTEVEREFAARGGDPGRPDWMYIYAGSNNDGAVAWHKGNSTGVQDVGQKNANRLDIHDLSGNVQEWCWDWMNSFVDVTKDTPVVGVARNTTVNNRNAGNQKAFNGGGVGSNPTMSCVAYRWGFGSSYKDTVVGFRVVRKP